MSIFLHEIFEVGGPMVVGFLTPQRNAMTLAAKEFVWGIFVFFFRDKRGIAW